MRLGAPLVRMSLVCLLAYGDSAFAQTIADADQKFLPFRSELYDPLRPEFQRFWDAIAAARKEEAQRALGGSISLGFNGDEADGQSLFKLKTGGSLSRSFYPAELRFTANLNLQIKNGDLQEDVTQLLVNYDFNHKSWAKYYVFVERFTDNFLSIQQRYETGFGGMFGLNLRLRKSAADLDDQVARLEKNRAVMISVKSELDGIPNDTLKGRTRPAQADYDNLNTAVQLLRSMLAAKRSTFFLGVAASVFSELEQARIETVSESGVKTPISLPAEHKWRLTLRPTVIVRPADKLEVTFYPYWKLPLDAPRKVEIGKDEEGKPITPYDYRLDLTSTITWNLARDATGNEKVDFVFRFDHRYDNVPPRIPGPIATERGVAPIVANKKHDSTSLELSIKWGN